MRDAFEKRKIMFVNGGVRVDLRRKSNLGNSEFLKTPSAELCMFLQK